MEPMRKTEDILAIRELRELLHGRFTEDEIKILYNMNNRDKQLTMQHFFSSEPHQVRKVIETERLQWTRSYEKVSDGGGRLPIEKEEETVKRKRKQVPRSAVSSIRNGLIETESRQFACAPCDSSWWRNVPLRKQVSTCHKCKIRYDPVPRDKEWGWAEFTCECGNTFGGFCQMGVPSPCYKCKKPVLPTRVFPPQKGKGSRSGQTHTCMGCQHHGHRGTTNVNRGGLYGHGGTTNVYQGGLYVSGGITIAPQCAHPSSRRQNNLPNVLTPSKQHDSTGSTVITFLPQDDLDMKKHEVYDRISYLGSIEEEPDVANLSDFDDGDQNNSNNDANSGHSSQKKNCLPIKDIN